MSRSKRGPPATAAELAAHVIEVYGLDAFLAAETGLNHAVRGGDEALAAMWREVEAILAREGRVRVGRLATEIAYEQVDQNAGS